MRFPDPNSNPYITHTKNLLGSIARKQPRWVTTPAASTPTIRGTYTTASVVPMINTAIIHNGTPKSPASSISTLPANTSELTYQHNHCGCHHTPFVPPATSSVLTSRSIALAARNTAPTHTHTHTHTNTHTHTHAPIAQLFIISNSVAGDAGSGGVTDSGLRPPVRFAVAHSASLSTSV